MSLTIRLASHATHLLSPIGGLVLGAGPKPVSTGWGNIVTPSGAASSGSHSFILSVRLPMRSSVYPSCTHNCATAAAVEELETEDLEDMGSDFFFTYHE